MDDVLKLYMQALDEFGGRVHLIGDGQWADATPCPPWTVRDLVNHVVWAQRWVPSILVHTTVEEIGSRFDGDLLGSHPVEAWENSRDDADAAFTALTLAG